MKTAYEKITLAGKIYITLFVIAIAAIGSSFFVEGSIKIISYLITGICTYALVMLMVIGMFHTSKNDEERETAFLHS